MQKVQGMKSTINLDPSPGSKVTPKPGFCINSIMGEQDFRIQRSLPKLLHWESQVA